MTVTIRVGDCRGVLKKCAPESFQCCITSPPYWGLRDYGLPPSVWGGNPDCVHVWGDEKTVTAGRNDGDRSRLSTGSYTGGGEDKYYVGKQTASQGQFCQCGAWLGTLGLEPTPEMYVEHLVEVFRLVRRVLRDDGTVWLNLGDSYAGSGVHSAHHANPGMSKAGIRGGDVPTPVPPGLKPKDLVGIPWMVAFALRASGWWLRSDIIWSKPNPMPESVTDRPTKAHEYLFLLTKGARYFYDADAIREPLAESTASDGRLYREGYEAPRPDRGYPGHGRSRGSGLLQPNPAGHNKRTVWTIPTKPYPEAHFATFPPALVEPCILAGTSERGCCPECGAPWERLIEPTGHVNKREPAHCPNNDPTKVDSTGWAPTTRATDQWQPTCNCGTEHPIPLEDLEADPTLLDDFEIHPFGPVPCKVLDPFAGACTVGLEADRLGRDAELIELNPGYAEMGAQRIKDASPMFAEVEMI